MPRFLPQLKGGDQPWRQYVYYRYYEDPWHKVAPHVALRSAYAKLIYFYTTEDWEFYDLINDPEELDNVYADPRHLRTIRKMKQEMENARVYYRDTTLRPIPGTAAPDTAPSLGSE